MKMFKTLRIICVLASAGAAANASEMSHYLRVNVPFAFVAAGQQFSAGEYRVTETETGVITLQGEGKAASLISTPIASPKSGDTSALRFTNSNNQSYLTSVSVEGEGTRSVPAHLTAERKVTLARQ
jgi:hypothetical protein